MKAKIVGMEAPPRYEVGRRDRWGREKSVLVLVGVSYVGAIC